MSTLITGAAGFIGSHLTKHLADNGTKLMLVDDFSRGKQEYLDYLGVKTKCLYGDLTNYETAFIFTKNIDTVYHLACRIGGMQFLHGSSEKELKALQDNLLIDTNVLRACIKNKVKKIIYSSSISVYNTAKQYFDNAVFSEDDILKDPIEPEGGYGWCVSGSTHIITKEGLKQIQYITPLKDFVLSKDGKWHRVLRIHKRKLLSNEKFVLFKPSRGIPFWITPQHKIFTSDGWKEVRKISEYKPGRRKNTEIVEPLCKDIKEIPPKILDFKYKGYRSSIRCSKDFWRFIGFWVAKGSLENHTGIFSNPGYINLAQKDVGTLKNYLRIIKKFDPDAKINIYKKCCILRFWHEGLWRWLRKNFLTERREKTVPLWLVNLSNLAFEEFFKGWDEGDGSHSKDRKSICITSSSEQLAGRMYIIMLSRGICCSLGVSKTYKKDNYKISMLINNYQNNGHFLNKKYPPELHAIHAYDIEVENEDSYSLPGCILHNSKYMGEKQLELMSNCGIKTGILRIFKSYGPCDDYSEESGQVVCSLMRKAINYPKEPFIVWGNGTVTRCLVYIDDLIDAMIKTEKFLDKAPHIVMNVGGNTPIPIRELAERIVKISGKSIKIKYDKSKYGGPQSRIPDLSRIKELIGWEPTTDLDTGLKNTYSWMNEVLTGES